MKTFKLMVHYVEMIEGCGDDEEQQNQNIKRHEKIFTRRAECEHDARRKILNSLLFDGYQVTLISNTFEDGAA